MIDLMPSIDDGAKLITSVAFPGSTANINGATTTGALFGHPTSRTANEYVDYLNDFVGFKIDFDLFSFSSVFFFAGFYSRWKRFN